MSICAGNFQSQRVILVTHSHPYEKGTDHTHPEIPGQELPGCLEGGAGDHSHGKDPNQHSHWVIVTQDEHAHPGIHPLGDCWVYLKRNPLNRTPEEEVESRPMERLLRPPRPLAEV